MTVAGCITCQNCGNSFRTVSDLDMHLCSKRFSIDQTLQERGTTHGNFGDNATFALQMRDLLRSMKPHWSNLSAEQRLALDEIALKIARIVSGGHNTVDSWKDIGGYAKLGEQIAASWQKVHNNGCKE